MCKDGLQKIDLTSQGDGTVSIKLGNARYLDIDYTQEPKIAIFKKSRQPAVAVDAMELVKTLYRLLAG